MPATSVIGLQWGDEGKGRVIDLLCRDADLAVRYQGGANAGHTVVVGGEEFVLHLLPSGVLHPSCRCVITHGVVVDPVELVSEIEELRRRGVSIGENLKVSPAAQLVLPYHRLLDRLEEGRRGSGRIGTTGRGIGPCYADKMARSGFRIGDVLRGREFEERLRHLLPVKNALLEHLYGAEPLDPARVRDEVAAAVERLAPHLADTVALVRSAIDAQRTVLFEGAQGALLDVDLGTWPYVTSSHTGSWAIPSGAGIPLSRVDRILGVVKAYTTRVGEGPFPTEAGREEAEELRLRGKEYGATTGRPRRCGWFDAVAARFTCETNQVDHLAVTKLDVLAGLQTVRICVAYEHQGERLAHYPAGALDLSQCRPVYEDFPGWGGEIHEARTLGELPASALRFIERIEELTAVEVAIVSVGPEREQFLCRDAGVFSLSRSR